MYMEMLRIRMYTEKKFDVCRSEVIIYNLFLFLVNKIFQKFQFKKNRIFCNAKYMVEKTQQQFKATEQDSRDTEQISRGFEGSVGFLDTDIKNLNANIDGHNSASRLICSELNSVRDIQDKVRVNNLSSEIQQKVNDTDSIGQELKKIRKIPFEIYMSPEKAMRARNSKHRRGSAKLVSSEESSSINTSLRPNSSCIKTGIDIMTEIQGRRNRRNQYKGIAKFAGLDDFMVRRYDKLTEKERYGMKYIIKQKKEKRLRREKKRMLYQETGSDAEVSAFSEQISYGEPLIDRQIQFSNRVTKPGFQSLDAKHLAGYQAKNRFSIKQKSLQTRKDHQSVTISGMLCNKHAKMQTLTQYDIVPEVIFNSLEIKIRELLRELLGPTINRQQKIEGLQTDLFNSCNKFDIRLRECSLNIKKQTNISVELDDIKTIQNEQDFKIRRLDTYFANMTSKVDNKIDKITGGMRLLKSDFEATTKIIEKKANESNKIENIISNFKDRMMEQYRILNDEYTDQFKKFDKKQNEMQNTLKKVKDDTARLFKNNQALYVEQVKDLKAMEIAREEIEDLKKCKLFEDRIADLEGRAKSDLLAVTMKMEEVLEKDSFNLKRSEALKLMYSLQVEAANAIMGIDQENARIKGKKFDSKQFDKHTQAQLNLIDWQMLFNKQNPFDLHESAFVAEKLTKNLKQDYLQHRKDHLMLQLNSLRKVKGYVKPQRSNSVPLRVIKIEEIPKISLPQPKKKVVCFALQQDHTLGKKTKKKTDKKEDSEKSLSLDSDSSDKDKDSKSKNSQNEKTSKKKKPSILKMRKFSKLVEPEKRRQIILLSKLNRSKSFNWTPKEKNTIDNLWTNPDQPKKRQSIKHVYEKSLTQPKKLGKQSTLQTIVRKKNIRKKRDNKSQFVDPNILKKLTLQPKDSQMLDTQNEQQVEQTKKDEIDPASQTLKNQILELQSQLNSMKKTKKDEEEIVNSKILKQQILEIQSQLKTVRNQQRKQQKHAQNTQHTQQPSVIQQIQYYPLPQPEIVGQSIAGPEVVQQPLSQSQVFNQPVIHPNVVQQPLSQSQVFNQPAAHPNVVQQSLSQSQVFNQPATHPDVVQQPQVHPEVVQQPTNYPEVGSQPIDHLQVVQQPQTHAQVFQQPATNAQVVQQPAAQPELQILIDESINRPQRDDRNDRLDQSQNSAVPIRDNNTTPSYYEQTTPMTTISNIAMAQVAPHQQAIPPPHSSTGQNFASHTNQVLDQDVEERQVTANALLEPNSNQQRSQFQTTNQATKDQNSMHSSDDNDVLFSSSEDSEPEGIESVYFDTFITQDELQDQLDQLKEEMQEQMMEEAGPMIIAQVDEIVQQQVLESQKKITLDLKRQFNEDQEQFKTKILDEMNVVKEMTDHVQSTVLPENLQQVKTMMKDFKEENKVALDDCIGYCQRSLKQFAQKIDFFQIELTTALTKFKRIVADQEIFKARTIRIQKNTREMVKVIRAEQLACSKIISTLVELEFIQQSLDFQDEFDKSEMHLYGLNDLNMTLEEFVSKSSEIASRKVHHEALQQASEIELQQLGDGAKKGIFEMTDSNTYQAIEMDQSWPEHLNDDNMRKQIHQAFKMACVYYKPSPVLYRGHKYNRRALIEAKRSILDAEWQLILKFQPFKRLWGEDSKVDFFEQFANKLTTLIQNKKMGMDVGQILKDTTDETFVKIMNNTNLFDMNFKKGIEDEELMINEDYQLNEDISISSPTYRKSPRDNDFQQSANIGIVIESQSPQKAQQLKGSRFSNQKEYYRSSFEEDVASRIDNRTRSMLNAMQRQSILCRSQDSNEDAVDKTKNIKNSKPSVSKRQQNRSVQQKQDKNLGALHNDSFCQTPNWINQSMVIYEKGPQDLDSKLSNISKKTNDERSNVEKLLRKNQALQSRQHLATQELTQKYAKDYSRENPMIEMRPLVGRDQQRLSQTVLQRGGDFESPDRSNFNTNDYDMRKSFQQIGLYGRQSQLVSPSPWNRSGQQQQHSHQFDKAARSSKMHLKPLDMTIIGRKEDQNSRQLLEKNIPAIRYLSKNSGTKAAIPPLNNFPISIPLTSTHTTIQNTPQNSNRQVGQLKEVKKSLNSFSHCVLAQPQGKTNNIKKEINTDQKIYGNGTLVEIAVTKGAKKQIKRDIAYQVNAKNPPHQKANAQQKREKQQLTAAAPIIKESDSLVSVCSPYDDLEGKMQAKLAATASAGFGNKSSGGESKSTAVNTQKLKDIARQKKQMQQNSKS